MVFQAPEDQVIATIVEEDVAFGLENQGIPGAEIRLRVEEALQAVDMEAYRARPSYMLSAGQMQRVALAGVLAMRPSGIIFDEATALLDPQGRRAVLEMMDRLHAEGLTIITITHSMEEAARAGRVIALDQGQVALDGSPEEVFSEPNKIQALGLDLPPAAQVASALHQVYPDIPEKIFRLPELIKVLPSYPGLANPALVENYTELPPTQNQIIEVRNLGHIYMAGTPLATRALEGANFTATEAGAYGLLGATGSGKSTLLQHLNGLLLPQEGSVRVANYDLCNPNTNLKGLRRMAGLAFQLPEAQIFEQYVGDEIAYGPRTFGMQEGLRERVRLAMETVGLDFEEYKDRLTSALSGGERRKVALASILAFQPSILLLDEPTANLDPASSRDLAARLKTLRNEGITLVISSHHMDEIAGMAEHLTVMSAGRDALSGPAGEVFAQVERLKSLGLEPPAAALVADALRQKGWPLSKNILLPNQLAGEMDRLVKARAR
jgi:energy-coupling factor transport system ATP-binding protein